MVIISTRTYKLLKYIGSGSTTLQSVTEKFGETAGNRVEELLNLKFIETISDVDMWQTPIESISYRITDSGKTYIQDYSCAKRYELLSTIRNSVIFPIVVSVITTLLTLLLTSLLAA